MSLKLPYLTKPKSLPALAVAKGIEALVCVDIAKRQALGINKYGRTVADDAGDLNYWLQHSYEECLDQAIYLKRAMAELEKGK